jgi:hypothetical protein
MAKTQKTAIAEFITALGEACNKSQILYCDMIYQEELFDFQTDILNILLEANRSKLFTNSELLKFNHVFGETKDA